MLKLNKTIAALLASAFVAAAAPAVAGDDYYHLQQNPGQYITHEAAAKAALKKFPGAFIKEVDFDMSRYHGAHYDVELIANGREYDVIIDARSGRILSSHIDY